MMISSRLDRPVRSRGSLFAHPLVLEGDAGEAVRTVPAAGLPLLVSAARRLADGFGLVLVLHGWPESRAAVKTLAALGAEVGPRDTVWLVAAQGAAASPAPALEARSVVLDPSSEEERGLYGRLTADLVFFPADQTDEGYGPSDWANRARALVVGDGPRASELRAQELPSPGPTVFSWAPERDEAEAPAPAPIATPVPAPEPAAWGALSELAGIAAAAHTEPEVAASRGALREALEPLHRSGKLLSAVAGAWQSTEASARDLLWGVVESLTVGDRLLPAMGPGARLYGSETRLQATLEADQEGNELMAVAGIDLDTPELLVRLPGANAPFVLTAHSSQPSHGATFGLEPDRAAQVREAIRREGELWILAATPSGRE